MRIIVFALLVISPGGAVTANSPKAIPPSADENIGYPQASWRADPSSLNGVAFDLDRIVISHRGAQKGRADLSVISSNRRSESEALELASMLAEELQVKPESFPELARKYSDDLSTRPWGGALGVVRATMLPPEIVDALDLVPEGATSRPILTGSGYEVVRRRAPRSREQLLGTVIFIPHSQARGPLHSAARTRAHAERIAEIVAFVAKLGASFSHLAARYSEYPGADVVLYTTNAGSRALLAHVLSTIPIGSTAGPIETAEGFYVVKRLADMCRRALASQEIIVGHRESYPSLFVSDLSRAQAARKAEGFAHDMTRSQGRLVDHTFEQSSRHGFPVSSSSWYMGERDPGLEKELFGLSVGSTSAEPVETRAGFHVVQREPDPTALAVTESFSHSVPKLGAVTFDALVRTASPLYVATVTARGGKIFADGLIGRKKTQFLRLLDSLTQELATAEIEARVNLVERARQRLAGILGLGLLTEYERFMDDQLRVIRSRNKPAQL